MCITCTPINNAYLGLYSLCLFVDLSLSLSLGVSFLSLSLVSFILVLSSSFLLHGFCLTQQPLVVVLPWSQP